MESDGQLWLLESFCAAYRKQKHMLVQHLIKVKQEEFEKAGQSASKLRISFSLFTLLIYCQFNESFASLLNQFENWSWRILLRREEFSTNRKLVGVRKIDKQVTHYEVFYTILKPEKPKVKVCISKNKRKTFHTRCAPNWTEHSVYGNNILQLNEKGLRHLTVVEYKRFSVKDFIRHTFKC